MVTARTFIKVLGGLAAIAGVIALMLPVTAVDIDLIFGVPKAHACGSVISPSSSMPGCDVALSDRRAWAAPMLAVGVLTLVGAYVVQGPARRPEPEGSEPRPA